MLVGGSQSREIGVVGSKSRARSSWVGAAAVLLLAMSSVSLTSCDSGPTQAVLVYDVEPTDSKTTKGEALRRAVNEFETRIDGAQKRGVVKEIPGGRVRVILPDMTTEQITAAREFLESGSPERFRVQYVPTK